MAEAAVAFGGGDGLGHGCGIVLSDAVADEDAGNDVGQFVDADGLRHWDILGVPPLRATRVIIGGRGQTWQRSRSSAAGLSARRSPMTWRWQVMPRMSSL